MKNDEDAIGMFLNLLVIIGFEVADKDHVLDLCRQMQWPCLLYMQQLPHVPVVPSCSWICKEMWNYYSLAKEHASNEYDGNETI
jgi:hypothetical protein